MKEQKHIAYSECPATWVGRLFYNKNMPFVKLKNEFYELKKFPLSGIKIKLKIGNQK